MLTRPARTRRACREPLPVAFRRLPVIREIRVDPTDRPNAVLFVLVVRFAEQSHDTLAEYDPQKRNDGRYGEDGNALDDAAFHQTVGGIRRNNDARNASDIRQHQKRPHPHIRERHEVGEHILRQTGNEEQDEHDDVELTRLLEAPELLQMLRWHHALNKRRTQLVHKRENERTRENAADKDDERAEPRAVQHAGRPG